MSSLINQTVDIFELKNVEHAKESEDPPTLLVELGTWNSPTGAQSGISVSAFGELAPLLSPGDARKLARWLQRAADELDGANRQSDRKGQKKRRTYEDDDEDIG